ncbi:MAG TPA: 30S ribosome-binding factor RbfA [Beijerinckiaceae bacterium]|nr:30S ribosome-binding factor RbfA [Beijerinckiaceae bacterium]
MSRSHHSGGEPSQRMLRVAELIRHSMAELLTRGTINDPVLEGHVVTVPRVKMSPDLKLASVYVMPLGGKNTGDVIAALDRHKKYLRTEIAHRINLKFAPEIRFKVDDSFDNVAKIDALLNSDKVKQDLQPRKEPAEK